MQFVKEPPVGAAAALSFCLIFGGLIVKSSDWGKKDFEYLVEIH